MKLTLGKSKAQVHILISPLLLGGGAPFIVGVGLGKLGSAQALAGLTGVDGGLTAGGTWTGLTGMAGGRTASGNLGSARRRAGLTDVAGGLTAS